MSESSESGLAFDPVTLAFYDEDAPEYAASGKNGVSRWLVQFMEMLPYTQAIPDSQL